MTSDDTSYRATADALYGRLGKKVAKVRAFQGLTQAELAKRSGVSLSQVKRLEAGKRRLTVLNLIKIANALGLRVRVQLR